jgi:hypothetical protein
VVRVAFKDGPTIAQAQRQVERAERTRKLKAAAKANGDVEAEAPRSSGWAGRSARATA